MASRLSIDVGTTFTDFLLFDEQSGEVRLLKTPSIAEDPGKGVLDGFDMLLEESGGAPGEIASLNLNGGGIDSLLRRRAMARIGLVVTAGFEQVLHLARGRTPARLNGWAGMAMPVPPASLADTAGVPERMDAAGQVVVPLDEAEARTALQALVASGVDAVAISLLHAYANAAHEKRLREIVGELAPDLPVVISSSTLPEFREYERAVAAVLTAALRPGMERDLERIGTRLRERSAAPSINVMRADGGCMNAEHAAQAPVHAIRTSATGAVTGAAFVAAQAGHPDALALDVGGGGAGVALLRDGRPAMARGGELAGLPLAIPVVAVERDNIGGASVAHVYGGGLLGLGPGSAGGDPGPACFGRGGEQATLTDAHAVLGRLPQGLLGGRLRLDMDAAAEAVGQIARQLNMELQPAAQAIVEMADELLLGSVRRVLARNRRQATGLALVATGGAGPLHANAVARLAGCDPVIVPAAAGAASALGHLHAAPRCEFFRSHGGMLEEAEPGMLVDIYGVLERKGQQWLAAEGVEPGAGQVVFEADLSYGHDGRIVSLSVQPEALGDDGLSDLAARFADVHRRRFGHVVDQPVALVTLRATATASGPSLSHRRYERGDPDASAAIIDQHPAWFDGAFATTDHYARERLRSGHRLHGPAIIVQADATTVLQPGYVADVDSWLNLVIKPEQPGGNRAGRA